MKGSGVASSGSKSFIFTPLDRPLSGAGNVVGLQSASGDPDLTPLGLPTPDGSANAGKPRSRLVFADWGGGVGSGSGCGNQVAGREATHASHNPHAIATPSNSAKTESKNSSAAQAFFPDLQFSRQVSDGSKTSTVSSALSSYGGTENDADLGSTRVLRRGDGVLHFAVSIRAVCFFSRRHLSPRKTSRAGHERVPILWAQSSAPDDEPTVSPLNRIRRAVPS